MRIAPLVPRLDVPILRLGIVTVRCLWGQRLLLSAGWLICYPHRRGARLVMGQPCPPMGSHVEELQTVRPTNVPIA